METRAYHYHCKDGKMIKLEEADVSWIDMDVGDTVRWYFASIGADHSVHTPHIHGHTFDVSGGGRNDQVDLLAGSSIVADMEAENEGMLSRFCCCCCCCCCVFFLSSFLSLSLTHSTLPILTTTRCMAITLSRQRPQESWNDLTLHRGKRSFLHNKL